MLYIVQLSMNEKYFDFVYQNIYYFSNRTLLIQTTPKMYHYYMLTLMHSELLVMCFSFVKEIGLFSLHFFAVMF